MSQTFQGWHSVATRLRARADRQDTIAAEQDEAATRLNPGQRASLRAIASRIESNGVVVADEVGMGKTRIAVELARCVIESRGRVAVLVPPGLGYQWHAELRDGGLPDVPLILRSIGGYLSVWDAKEPENQRPWFREPAVMISHAFTNWKLGERTQNWRWALLPELYARWRKVRHGRLPNNYHENNRLHYSGPFHAGISIAAMASDDSHPAGALLDRLLDKVQWPRPLDPAEYSKNRALRDWLEVAVGAGLGAFDLVVIDEAHKSRGEESGLSRLLGNVILPTASARRLALTATPVEMDVGQWHHTLGRLGLGAEELAIVQEVTTQYADAVIRLRQTWRSNPTARASYKGAAAKFQQALAPYLIRRDKREDPDVIRFHEYTRRPLGAYRRESEIAVKTADLSPAWREAVCAAEALSVVTRHATDPVAKRLRLTLGNGHGIAALLDQTEPGENDHQSQAIEQPSAESARLGPPPAQADTKREKRAEWWTGVVTRAFAGGADSLFDHPAIRSAVEAIEAETRGGGKVLVFGRFIRPLRALVDLLNARELLRRVAGDEPWPRSKVHGEREGHSEASEWPAVRAAYCQLQSQLGDSVSLDALDDLLKRGHERQRRDRDRFRDALVSRVEQGFVTHDPGAHTRSLFAAFKRAAGGRGGGVEEHSLTVVARAMLELLGSPDAGADACAATFAQLVEAASDREHAETGANDEPDETELGNRWEVVEQRMREEYNRTQGSFARLMYGDTTPESRRMIQLAFNRPGSFPHVLVAQSLVGREGLNLHRACRVVVLLHPEWNPAVVEQQIGRVDRVDSFWCQELRRAVADGVPPDMVPRIEVRPVVFRGTYDDHNWRVLKERWDALRAQLHGIVLPSLVPGDDQEAAEQIAEISAAAPTFSPTTHSWLAE